MASKETDSLKIALQMREAVGYLAALASKSELDKIARKLLGVHLDLGAKIEALIEIQNASRVHERKSARPRQKPGTIKH